MSQPRQLTEEEKRRFQEFVKNRAVVANKAPAKSSGSKKDDSSTNLFQWCVDDIVERLKSVEGLDRDLKAQVFTKGFKTLLFNNMLDNAVESLSDPKTTTLDFRFIKNWKAADNSGDREFLLGAEAELDIHFTHKLYRSFIEEYISTCADLTIPFNPEIIVPYYAV
jgi:hypothetical protein